jgi:beta-lactam-binding protein with PASTA domain
MVTVPDVRRLRASEAFYAVGQSDLRIKFVRLTEHPAGGDGIVVDQDPSPGSSVRRSSTVTVQVVHPVAEEDTSNLHR